MKNNNTILLSATIALFFMLSCKVTYKSSVEDILNKAVGIAIEDPLYINYRKECLEDFDNKFLFREEFLFSFYDLYIKDKELFEKYFSNYLSDNLSISENLKVLKSIDSNRYNNFRIHNINLSLLEFNTFKYDKIMMFDFIESEILMIVTDDNNCSLRGISYTFLLNSGELSIIHKNEFYY